MEYESCEDVREVAMVGTVAERSAKKAMEASVPPDGQKDREVEVSEAQVNSVPGWRSNSGQHRDITAGDRKDGSNLSDGGIVETSE